MSAGMLLARGWTCSSLKPSTREQFTSTSSPCQGATHPHPPHTRDHKCTVRAGHGLGHTEFSESSTGRLGSPADDVARSAWAPARSRRFRLWMVCAAVDRSRVYASASTAGTYIHRSRRAGSSSYTAHVQKITAGGICQRRQPPALASGVPRAAFRTTRAGLMRMVSVLNNGARMLLWASSARSPMAFAGVTRMRGRLCVALSSSSSSSCDDRYTNLTAEPTCRQRSVRTPVAPSKKNFFVGRSTSCCQGASWLPARRPSWQSVATHMGHTADTRRTKGPVSGLVARPRDTREADKRGTHVPRGTNKKLLLAAGPVGARWRLLCHQ